MPRASRSRKTVHDDDDDDEEQEEQQEEEEDEEEEEEMHVNDEEEEEELQDDEEEEVRPSRRKGRSSKKKSTRSKKVVNEDNEEDEEEQEEEEEEEQENQAKKKQKQKQQKKKNPSKKPRTSVTAALTNNESSDDEEEEQDNDNDGGGTNSTMQFMSQVPDQSQDLPTARTSDRTNLMKLGHDARQKAITDLVRTILFKAMAGEPIHRQSIIKEAQISNGSNSSRISSAAFEEANIVLQNTFDFKLVRVPAWMERTKDFPAKFKERYYLVNNLDDPTGQVCKIIHGTHSVDAIEKGLLMVILAFIFCKGGPRSDGSRWLLDKDLYRLLHGLDDNIHAEPPAAASSNNKRSSRGGNSAATTGTPDVDALVEKFANMDYLIKIKAGTGGEHFMAMSQEVEESSHFYALGPRAALEIGRAQIVHFCATILDQEPDPNMLAEIEQAEQEEEQE